MSEPTGPTDPVAPSGTSESTPTGGYAEAPPPPPPPPPSAGYAGVGYGLPSPGSGPPPSPVRTAVILLYIGAGLGILVGIFLLLAASVVPIIAIGGVLVIGLAIAYLVLARRIAVGNRTARTVAVVLAGIGVLFDLLGIGRSPISGIIGIALNGLIIYLLQFNPESKRFFRDTV